MAQTHSSEQPLPNVLRVQEVDITEVQALLERYSLKLMTIQQNEAIPGSFWGDEEAGLVKNQLYVRPDTPLHSLLHESCHYICMDNERRQTLHTNAGGTSDEENAVCFLQILLSEELSYMGKEIMMKDMDTWGYSFRLGSCQAWFEKDTHDEYQWLLQHELITADKRLTFKLRT